MAYVKLLSSSAQIPTRALPGDAGFDLYSPSDYDLYPSNQLAINVDVAVKLPVGTCGMVAPRSSMNRKGIHTKIGIIDAGYRGSIGVILRNETSETHHIRRGDRIAQLIIIPLAIEEPLELVQSLDETERGEGGFGSTGK